MSPIRKQATKRGSSTRNAGGATVEEVAAAVREPTEVEAAIALADAAAKAEEADEELAELLLTLEAIQAARRKDPVLEARYESLRASVVALLGRDPKWLSTPRGRVLALVSAPQALVVDPLLLEDLERDDGLPYEVLDEVAPRKVDLVAFRRAVSSGRITSVQLLKVASMVPKTPFVRFVDEDKTGGHRE